MKIYEIRDITDDEKFYTYGFYSTKEKAIEVLNFLAGDINDWGDDFVTAALIEHTLDCNKPDGYGKTILEKQWEKNYDEEVEEAWLEARKDSKNGG